LQIPRLRQWRELRGLTQRELAAQSGVSARGIAGYEAGAGVRPNTARKLAEALDVEVASLVGEPSSSPLGEAPPSAQGKLFDNGVLEEQRPAVYLEGVLEEVRGRHAWARSVLDRSESFAEPPEEAKPPQEGVITTATMLTMWNTEINALLADVGQLSNIWNERLERVSNQAMPVGERRLADALRGELEAFAVTVSSLRERLDEEFDRHREADQGARRLAWRRLPRGYAEAEAGEGSAEAG
jgi:transcriptional regulator with XRE-family HTH domain